MLKESWWMLGYLKRTLSPKKRSILFRDEVRAWSRFWRTYQVYKRKASYEKQPVLSHLYPCIWDNDSETYVEPTYFYQDAWAFEKIIKEKPSLHIDVSSHHKYVALLSKVVPLTMVDIRPLSLEMNTINFIEGSILNLPFDNNSIESLSSLCVVEHIGLGRYGDELDPDGTEKALIELKRVVKPGGNLYISLPINDINTTYFNAHRAFSEEYIEEIMKPLLIMERNYIYGNSFQNNRQAGFGTGLYHFKK